MNVLGKKIKLLRQQKGWNQHDIANKLAISIPALSKIESGVTDINLSRLEQIAAIFGLSAAQLLDLDVLAERSMTKVEFATVNQKLAKREAEVMTLQKRLIELYQELKNAEARQVK
ncbi:helix-turn-helix transcriptional regulator [Mucilaginibacter corticis]|uniref:Helix-turn-helix transcriptional regulator n=1 Tax=Mucilaginibacter corticis TaxID=2597670 RepID=A0A556M906_9SPHI|nr:helix-turn-helix transcriptional regulator [Mucilaginibacter corticis]TSJ36382.1 helix-turn-helix transcriptional regulator [Mucilaginibacter corticis]